MNIGIFSGSFNPIHIGHIILANYIVEFTEIDEVWFVVSPQNPLKDANQLNEDERLEMVELSLSKYTKLKACNFEFSLPKPSYTINTLEALDEAYPEHTFSLIIGADNWNAFEKWKDYTTILQKFYLKVYPRYDYRISIPPRQRERVDALDSPMIEISSTFIRESIAEGKDMRAFLPEEAYDYIKEKGFYK